MTRNQIFRSVFGSYQLLSYVLREREMRIVTLPIVAVVVFNLLLPNNAFSNELADRTALKNEVVRLFALEQFSQLEELSARYRTSKSRTSSGLWQLTVFYSGFSWAFNAKHKEHEFWLNTERSAKKWVTDYPNSATAHLAYAEMLLNHGWSFRGYGYAKSVAPQNWKPFHDYVQKARAYLEKYKDVASSDPHWYDLMIKIAYAQSWPELEISKILSEGLQRESLFYEIYFAAIEYYTPKWGGSAAAIENFAREALERTRSAEGFTIYARIYWYASQAQFGDRLFSESLVDWATMKKGINDVLKKYPDNWNINFFAKFACLSKDKAMTAELIARITEAPLKAAWKHPSLFQRCKAWASNSTPTPEPISYRGG